MILATFSLDWFMTIPGMLITGGVLFLIIALVIFIVTGNKKAKTNKEVVEAQDASKQEAITAVTPTVEQNTVVTKEQVATPQPIVTSEPVVPTNPVSSMAEKTVPQEVEPVVFTTPIPEDVAPTPQPVFENPTSNTVDQSVPVERPTMPSVSSVAQSTVSTQNEVTPVVPTIEQTPIVNQPVVPEIPVKEEKKETIQTPSVDMPRPIYGGVSPIVPNVAHEEEHRLIYGGANPLENTQSVPIVPQRPVVTEEVKVAVPTVEIPTVSAAPSVATVVTPQSTDDIFANSPVTATSVTPQPTEPQVAVQPAVNQNQSEEIESLF